MKICYNLLAEVKKGIPENDFFRILLEEKLKVTMEIVDKTEDIELLEQMLGGIPIEIVTRNLADIFEVINVMRTLKPW